MSEPIKKRVDESWKDQVEHEKHKDPAEGREQQPPDSGQRSQSATGEKQPERTEGLPPARFDVFLQGLVVEAFVALGEMPHPATRKQAASPAQAKYLIDLIGVIEEKTRGNLSADEEKLLKDALYQLRMRYLNKTGG